MYLLEFGKPQDNPPSQLFYEIMHVSSVNDVLKSLFLPAYSYSLFECAY